MTVYLYCVQQCERSLECLNKQKLHHSTIVGARCFRMSTLDCPSASLSTSSLILRDIRRTPIAQYVKHLPTGLAVPGSIPASGGYLSDRKRGSIAHSLALTTKHRPDMTEILFIGRKIASHSSIYRDIRVPPNDTPDRLYRKRSWSLG